MGTAPHIVWRATPFCRAGIPGAILSGTCFRHMFATKTRCWGVRRCRWIA